MILKRKEVTVKETTIKETVIHSDLSEYLSDFSSDISKLFAEEMKGQSPEQVDLPTQYNIYYHARKCIRPALYGICAIGFALAKLAFALAWFSDTSFGQFIFDLFI